MSDPVPDLLAALEHAEKAARKGVGPHASTALDRALDDLRRAVVREQEPELASRPILSRDLRERVLEVQREARR